MLPQFVNSLSSFFCEVFGRRGRRAGSGLTIRVRQDGELEPSSVLEQRLVIYAAHAHPEIPVTDFVIPLNRREV